MLVKGKNIRGSAFIYLILVDNAEQLIETLLRLMCFPLKVVIVFHFCLRLYYCIDFKKFVILKTYQFPLCAQAKLTILLLTNARRQELSLW